MNLILLTHHPEYNILIPLGLNNISATLQIRHHYGSVAARNGPFPSGPVIAGPSPPRERTGTNMVADSS